MNAQKDVERMRHGPDFLGIGTERAGTSWVFTMLAAHPGIWVPPLKELHYFDTLDPSIPSLNYRYNRHLPSRIKQKAAHFIRQPNRPEFYKNSWREYLRWDACYFTGRQDDDWYGRLFDPVFTRGRVCGEYTPAYSNLGPAMIRRILSLNPDMKFILFIRHPVEQMRSSLIQNFVMAERRNFASVSEAEMLAWLHSPAAHVKANLPDILRNWLGEVKREQIFIGHFSDIKNRPLDLIGELYDFLGVDKGFRPAAALYSRKINHLSRTGYKLPAAVRQYIEDRYGPEAERMKNLYPEIAKKWPQ